MQPPPPPPGQPMGPAGQPGAQPSNGLGITSMILGILSIPLCCLFGFGGLVGIVAVVLGFLGKKKADQGLATNRGMAMAGIITGLIGIALAVVWWVLGAVGASVDWGDYTD